MMEKKTQTSEAKTAYGKKLETPFNYTYSWDAYETDAELVTAKDEMTLEEQRKFRNNERLANARQKELQAQLDARGIVKPNAENDPQIGLKDMYRTLLTAKKPDGTRKHTNERARELAVDLIGVEWTEESLAEILAAERKAAAAEAAKTPEGVTIQ